MKSEEAIKQKIPTIGQPPIGQLPRRFYGRINLNQTRVCLDASIKAGEVISHLAGLLCSRVSETFEIEAEIHPISR